MKIVWYVILIIVMVENSYSYVFTRNNLGQVVKWDNYVLEIFLNSHLPTEQHNILIQSIAQWKGHSKLKLSLFHSIEQSYNKMNNNGYNDILLSTDNTLFSSNCSVLGITTSIYDSLGNTTESDIYLNGYTGCLSNNDNDENYIGNVLSHELGHVLGLAHSEVNGSTMYYKARKGQNTLAKDDIAGIFSLYPNQSNRGEIFGKVVGGEDLIGIFGAHVQAISAITGEVHGAVISDINGSFAIKGLNFIKDDDYFLHISPISSIDNLPSYYANIRSNFCFSNNSYVGSFFQTCDAGYRGHPYAIKVPSQNSSLSVGNVSIRCNLDTAPGYLLNKPQNENDVEIIDSENNIGENYVGFFKKKYNYDGDTIESIEFEGEDKFLIDLSSVDFSTFITATQSIYLEYRILVQSIYSKLITEVVINNTIQSFSFNDPDGVPTMNRIGRIQLSTVTPSENVFNFIIRPINKWGKCSDSLILTTDQLCPINGFDEDEIFKLDTLMYDPIHPYFVNFYISAKENAVANSNENYQIISSKTFESGMDNTYCSDAPYSYSMIGNTPELFANSTRRNSTRKNIFACSSINMNDNEISLINAIISFFLAPLLYFVIMLIVIKKQGRNRK